MAKTGDNENARLDDAARAGWLYYVAGNTQDEIARKLGVSRQTAQRLVSLGDERAAHQGAPRSSDRALHGALGCAADNATISFICEVAPSDPASTSTTLGIAQLAAAEMERWLRRPDPVVVGIGTGRTMRAVADQMPAMQCPQHKLVALVGIGKSDGSASFYDVIIRLSDTVRAPHYPMPLPVYTRSAEERELLTNLPSTRSLLALIDQADVSFVGVGSIGEGSALLKDGFITAEENEALRKAGAVGEITAWSFDSAGTSHPRSAQRALRRRAASTAGQARDDRRRDGSGASRRDPRCFDRAPHHRPYYRRGDRGASPAALIPSRLAGRRCCGAITNPG